VSGSPRGRDASQLDLQELDLRVHAKLVLLQTEYFLVKGHAPLGVLAPQEVLNPGPDGGLFRPDAVDVPFDRFNLSRF
jgi:hypothetical protein